MTARETLAASEQEVALVLLLEQREAARVGLSSAVKAMRAADGEIAAWINGVSEDVRFNIEGMADEIVDTRSRYDIRDARTSYLKRAGVKLEVVVDREQPHSRQIVRVYEQSDPAVYWSMALENVRSLAINKPEDLEK